MILARSGWSLHKRLQAAADQGQGPAAEVRTWETQVVSFKNKKKQHIYIERERERESMLKALKLRSARGKPRLCVKKMKSIKMVRK